MGMLLEEEHALASELEALERHRMRYLARFPGAPVQQDDPDVRRVIEALALFSLRTRRIARRNAQDAIGQLFRRHFEGLLNPSPAAARVVAKIGPNFADIVDVPRGTELLLTKDRFAITMTTLEPMRVLPLEVQSIHLSSAERTELVVTLTAKHRRSAIKVQAPDETSEMDGEIAFEIDQLGELTPSAAVLDEIRESVVGLKVEYESDRAPRVLEVPLEQGLRFGALTPPLIELTASDQPLSRLRSFFHNPWTELRMVVRVPAPAQGETWQRLRLRLRLRRPWPRHLGLQPTTFAINRVPVVNLKRDWASPIRCDGTRDRVPILHPLPGAHLQPHSLLGVYEFTPQGPVPLLPIGLRGEGKGYDLEVEGEGTARRLWLHIDAPTTFAEPITLGVEALWYQPAARSAGTDDFDTRLANGFVSSLTWTATPLLHDIQPLHASDTEVLMRLLALKQQTTLTRDELVFLLEALGANHHRDLRRVVDSIREVRRREIPYAKGVGGLKTVCTVVLRDLDASLIPAMKLFAPRLREFLTLWSRDDVDLEIQLTDHPEHSLSPREVRDHALPVAAATRGVR